MAEQDPKAISKALVHIREQEEDELYFDPATGKLVARRPGEVSAADRDRLPATEMAREGFFAVPGAAEPEAR